MCWRTVASNRWRPACSSDADVMLERRRLVEWLFAPVLGIVGRL